MELALAILGLLTAAIGGWVVWVRWRSKTPLERANEKLETVDKSREKILIAVEKKDTQAMEDDYWKDSRELAALFGLRRKGRKTD